MRVYIDVRPVSSRFPFAKYLLLHLQILWGYPRSGRKAGVNDGTDQVCFWIDCVVELSRIPQNQITRLGTDLDNFATPFFEPFQIFILERIKVVVQGSKRTFGPVRREFLEELFKQRCTALHDDQATVLGASFRH